MVLQAIKYERGLLKVLDQLQLPHHEDFIDVKNPQGGWNAIRSMQVRGAPAIAIVAALSLAVYLTNSAQVESQNAQEVARLISHSLKFLTTGRPTAVNLLDAARKLERVSLIARYKDGANGDSVRSAYVEAAESMLRDDIHDNENIGRHGAQWVLSNCKSQSPDGKISVVTHCNTGSLATAGYGTALGVIRSLHSRASLRRAFYTETRPYNQGARLTGFELLHDEIPAELVTDSMVGLLLSTRKQSEQIACIVVGADRVAANGDTANKIGTYSLAVLARHHGVKFLVAAPRTSIDRETLTGSEITIEQRPPREMTCVKGPELTYLKDGSQALGSVREVAVAPLATQAWNPSFDVTPADLIDGIITEKGVVEKDQNGEYRFDSIFDGEKSGITVNGSQPHPSEAADGPSWQKVVQMKADEVKPWESWIEGVI